MVRPRTTQVVGEVRSRFRAPAAERIPGCAHCEKLHEFQLPEQIVEAAASGKLSLFAGAGISTENRDVFITSLYEEVAEELAIDPRTGPPFPQLMSRYCKSRAGRAGLLMKIKRRIDYLNSFPEVHAQATRFHQELATFPHVHDIFTTNWDDLFEQECAAQPIVSAEDFVFWDLPYRKVFKLHGSINNPGSLVITAEDYERCYRKLGKGLLGSTLKLALGTSTLLFAGYSFRDADFVRLYGLIRGEMKELLPHAFAVTLDKETANRYAELGITPIHTDAAHFLSAVKEELVSTGHMLPDSWIVPVVEALNTVRRAHLQLYERIRHKNYPLVILTACYQDGLIHAFGHLISQYRTGKYSDPANLVSSIETYQGIKKRALAGGHYHDVAYIDGYGVGLTYVLDSELQRRIPKYHVPGYGFAYTLSEVRKALAAPSLKRGKAHRYAVGISDRLAPNIVFHHRAFL